MPAAVLRAAVVLGSGSASFEMLRYLTERLPAMVTPRWVRNRVQPISIRDVVRYLAACATAQCFTWLSQSGSAFPNLSAFVSTRLLSSRSPPFMSVGRVAESASSRYGK